MQKLYTACAHLPPDFECIRSLLQTGTYTPEMLAKVLLEHMDKNCTYEVSDFSYENNRSPENYEIHCGYLYEMTKLFLEFGFDPNLVIDHDGFANQLQFADLEYVAADTMKLLIEHGLDPNAQFDSESVFDFVEDHIILDVSLGLLEDDEDWRYYNIEFHLWLVLIGYGAKLSNGNLPIKMKDSFTTDIFRQHEKYDYRIEYTKEDPDGWIMYIFDRETNEVVATV